MKVVFDTNVVVSASFWRGKPFDCLAAWARGRCQAFVSPQLLAEYSGELTQHLHCSAGVPRVLVVGGNCGDPELGIRPSLRGPRIRPDGAG